MRKVKQAQDDNHQTDKKNPLHNLPRPLFNCYTKHQSYDLRDTKKNQPWINKEYPSFGFRQQLKAPKLNVDDEGNIQCDKEQYQR